jgi:hypothetical protein
MCCEEGTHGHHARHGIHHSGMMHGMQGCCCGGEEMHGYHARHCIHHGSVMHGMHGCCCEKRRFLSRREKIELLEELRNSLLNELEGVEEELNALKKE